MHISLVFVCCAAVSLAACGPTAPTPASPAPSSGPTAHSHPAREPAPPPTSEHPEPPPEPDTTQPDSGVAPTNPPEKQRPRPVEISCNQPDQLGPLQLTSAEYAARHGVGAHNLAEVETSKEQPVEVCGVSGQQKFLLAATCADGSQPLGSSAAVYRARQGSVGLGGRCNTIIDRYEVPCPEKTYRVYMDMYFCQKGQEWK